MQQAAHTAINHRKLVNDPFPIGGLLQHNTTQSIYSALKLRKRKNLNSLQPVTSNHSKDWSVQSSKYNRELSRQNVSGGDRCSHKTPHTVALNCEYPGGGWEIHTSQNTTNVAIHSLEMNAVLQHTLLNVIRYKIFVCASSAYAHRFAAETTERNWLIWINRNLPMSLSDVLEINKMVI